jgi:3-hydroxyisobutyrate dehydrogenase
MADNRAVAVLGAGGTMGFGIARNIARAGIELRAWDRTRDKAEPLTDDGGAVFDSPAEAVQGAGVVLTILSDAGPVIESIKSALPGLAEGAIWLQMSTIGERGTAQCISLAGEHGISFIDAPVLGSKQPAEEGKLVVLASGPEQLRDRVQPIFDAVGQRTMWLGAAGHGSRMKLATNLWVLTVVEGCAEAVAFTEGVGLDPGLLFEAIAGGPLDSPYFQIKGKAIRERDFEPQFSLSLAAKDARLIEDATRRHDLDLPLVTAVAQRLEEGARKHPDEDMSATYLTSAPARATR